MDSVEPMTPEAQNLEPKPRPESLITEIDGERQDWVSVELYNQLERRLQAADGDFHSGFSIGAMIATLVIAALYGLKQLLFYTPPDITGW
jgi:hypothetical protein